MSRVGGRRDGADAHAVKQRWLARALASADIDGRRWHPSAGVDSNRQTIERVYGYYAGLYLRHGFLQWAGMAALIGPAFYAGFRDLGALPDAVRRAVRRLLGRASRRIARWAAGDLGFYETTFLLMQKKIFEDQAVMHEAYLHGGIGAVRELHDVSIIDEATLEAWRRIDAGAGGGDGGAVGDGNRTLLFREQHDIIDRFYLRMFDDPPLGRAFTYLLTLAGAPSVPGARSFAEVFPLGFRLPMPRRSALAVATPFAAGNIALFADRWGLIEADTLPDYLRFIHGGNGEASALIGTPIAERVARFRLLARAGTLARNLLTHWTLRLVRPGRPEPRRPAVSMARPLAPVTIDLRRPPERAEPEDDYRVWERPDRRPFEVRVLLPGERQYRASAVRAALLASRRGAAPDRLVVTLPALGLDEAHAVLGQLAAEWGVPAETIADWRARAELRARRDGDYQDRAYSTHVLRGADAGGVRLEAQVAQHLGEGTFVITALFTWT